MDYLATGKLDVDASEALVKGVVDGCLMSEAALIGGETAEMPGLYGEGEYDMAGFAIGEVDKDKVIDGSKIREGDTLIGLASSGFHSNGYSLVRKLVKDVEIKLKKGVLTPTRIYWKNVNPLLEKSLINGMAHITGGGFSNIARMNKNFDYEVDNVPGITDLPWFMQEVLERLDTPKSELYKTFNMGVGLIICTSEPESVLELLESTGESPIVMGKTKKGSGKVVINVEGQKVSV